MTTEEAVELIQQFLKEGFGKMLQMRSVSVHRTAAGRVWRADVVCMTAEGEMPVGQLGVGESGEMVEPISVDDLISVFQSCVPQQPGQLQVAPHPDGGFAALDEDPEEEGTVDPLAGLESSGSSAPSGTPQASSEEAFDFDLGLDDDESPPPDAADQALDMITDSFDEVWNQVAELLESEPTDDELTKARDLLPRLLSHPDQRGKVLSAMSFVELQLGHQQLALEYLEASARELADDADLHSLEGLCRDVLDLWGVDTLANSVFERLLHETKMRLSPLDSIGQIPFLAGLSWEALQSLNHQAEEVTLEADRDLLREGDPSVNVFFVREGRLSVLLEAPDGAMRAITKLVPGDLVGESSVLSEGQAFCNATVHTEQRTTVWLLDGQKMRELFARFPELKQRIGQARQMRQIHSFLSMHQAVGELDATVRDSLLGCISEVEDHARGHILIPAGQMPQAAYLVVNGAVQQRIQDRVMKLYGQDEFLGFRDSLHGISSECEFVAIQDSTVARFSAERLMELGLNSPPNVVAILERLG